MCTHSNIICDFQLTLYASFVDAVTIHSKIQTKEMRGNKCMLSFDHDFSSLVLCSNADKPVPYQKN